MKEGGRRKMKEGRKEDILLEHKYTVEDGKHQQH
jgi:hypothetical protein